MNLGGLLEPLLQEERFQALLDSLREQAPLPDQNILRAARAYVVAALVQALHRPVLLVTARHDRAYNLTEQLPVWLAQARISRFMEPSQPFYERVPWSEETIRARMETLGVFFHWQPTDPPPIVVASAHALMQKTLPPREFRLGSRRLSVGSRFEPEKLLRLWLELGYEPVSIVTQPGQFSRRGGILDVFPPIEMLPVRLDFWGDEIESLRRFDPHSQRSLDPLESILFVPMREALPKSAARAAEKLAAWVAAQPHDDHTHSIQQDWEALQKGAAFPNIEFYLPWLYENHASLLDYLPPETLVIVDDWGALRDSVEEIETAAIDTAQAKAASLPPDMPLPYYPWQTIQEQLKTRQALHLGRGDTPTADAVVGDLFGANPRFGGQIRHFVEHLSMLKGQAVVVSRQADHLTQIWSERASPQRSLTDISDLSTLGNITFVNGELGDGWQIGGVHIFTDAEIFGWQRPEPRRRQRPRPTAPEALFADLQVGDYVVHVEHGIARFGGLIRRSVNGEERELLQLEYAENDMLFVPIHQAERITRYLGTNDNLPKLNRIGTQEWVKIRQKATQSAEEVAEELLRLYAEREVAKGHAFSPDTPWQHELEASFPYVETEDQLHALVAVKEDMEAPRPMDRLICGDVGYGKTEIALRAAFKAAMDGKQVAVLVPTTILAFQHYQTFSQRTAPFPLKVEMLSRFRSEAEQRTILADLAEGKVDVVIGTHRLLQQDVRFKQLGLLVIDEEQRFGITHKEQLKRLRYEVDVLTLTATPIPRTLYMSLSGIRDISVISTPPDERLPVATHVGIHDPKLVRQVILRELDRGGQVYYVYNRVQGIEVVAQQLNNLIPEASIGVGHGQLPEDKLEDVLISFRQGQYDILVCTSIIESGLDIPNANTIIIDRAEWFGLADLYQLRGRVGRGATQGYAYLFHPHGITDEARERLETIAEKNQLGAGLTIAMRDLEIRGAGELLGTRQSGHIAAVGFHLYTQLLSQAVQRLRKRRDATGTPVPVVPLTVDLPIPTYIPSEYIPETALRIQLYRRLAQIDTHTALDALRQELHDRFGVVPRAVEGLLYQFRVKLMATAAHVTSIIQEGGKIGIKLPYLGTIDRTLLQDTLGEQVRVSRTALWLERDESEEKWMLALLEVLEKLQGINVPDEIL